MWRSSIIALILVWTCGCGKQVPRAANVAPGTPYVSWIIMYGDRDNPDREFACQSDPRTDCVVPPSRPDAEVFTNVHIYYHGAGGETRYEGPVDVGFLQGSGAARESQSNITVKKNESIANQSVTGIVTRTTGTYHLKFSLTATVTDTKRTQPIRDQIPIVVK